jgi:hypothetical protein
MGLDDAGAGRRRRRPDRGSRQDTRRPAARHRRNPRDGRCGLERGAEAEIDSTEGQRDSGAALCDGTDQLCRRPVEHGGVGGPGRRAQGAVRVASGRDEAEGALFRVVLGAESVATTVDRKAIEAAMGESWLARFLKFGKPSRSFSCYARTAKAKRAA